MYFWVKFPIGTNRSLFPFPVILIKPSSINKSDIFKVTNSDTRNPQPYKVSKKSGFDGEVIYENTDWEHPKVINYDTPIILQAGEGLTSVATYVNDTNKDIGFGLTSEDEMDIIFGYYYER